MSTVGNRKESAEKEIEMNINLKKKESEGIHQWGI